MDWNQIFRSNGLDRYDRNARLYPAFMCLLPLFAVIALWLPQVWTLLGGLLSLAVACGLVFYLAQVVRYLGRKTESRLGNRVGRARSAVLVSHSDTQVASDTKIRYHKYLADHGVKVPDRELELKDPAAAYQAFRSAVDWLLEHTRKNAAASMLLDENIAYGFRRNLLGLKPTAIILIILAIAANAYLIATKADQNRMLAAGVVELILILALIAWFYVVRPAFVEDASLAYAQRFLAQCENTRPPRKPRNAGT
jgi:hypothetical protein